MSEQAREHEKKRWLMIYSYINSSMIRIRNSLSLSLSPDDIHFVILSYIRVNIDSFMSVRLNQILLAWLK